MKRTKYHIHNLLLLVSATIFLLATVHSGIISAENRTTAYFFWGKGCPHCAKEEILLEQLKERYPQLEVKSFEVWFSPENARLFVEIAEAYGMKPQGVPITFIGDFEPITGYRSDDITGRIIEDRIKYCIEHGCKDPREKIGKKLPAPQTEPLSGEPRSLSSDLGKRPSQLPYATRNEKEKTLPPSNPAFSQGKGTEEKIPSRDNAPEFRETTPQSSPMKNVSEAENEVGRPSTPREEVSKKQQPSTDRAERIITLPVFGEMDTTKIALPVLTLVLAGLDSFNPCAFFVLFMLLSILVYAKSRKRMLLIGGTFVFFSGLIYFLFMSAWLNIFLHIGELMVITTIAGIIAVIIAAINIKDFFLFEQGVSLVIPEKAKPRLFERMRTLLKATSLPSMMAGTIVLAIVSNAYELLCTVGFPMVFTRVLTLQNLPVFHYYLYLLIYNVIYVIPLAVIVLTFSITLGARKLTEWQGRVLKLVSGLMMLFLGLVLLINPTLLNNMLLSIGLLASALSVAILIIFTTKRIKRVSEDTK
jgi:thiol-disulfide isomerase/thioredoxin